MARLASLRRLYHHLAHGGHPTPRDELWLGELVTADNLRRQIRDLELATTPMSRRDHDVENKSSGGDLL